MGTSTFLAKHLPYLLRRFETFYISTWHSNQELEDALIKNKEEMSFFKNNPKYTVKSKHYYALFNREYEHIGNIIIAKSVLNKIVAFFKENPDYDEDDGYDESLLVSFPEKFYLRSGINHWDWSEKRIKQYFDALSIISRCTTKQHGEIQSSEKPLKSEKGENISVDRDTYAFDTYGKNGYKVQESWAGRY